MLAEVVRGAGGGAEGGPALAPGSGTERSSGEPATELPDTELRDVAFVRPGRHTDWNNTDQSLSQKAFIQIKPQRSLYLKLGEFRHQFYSTQPSL